MVELFALFDEQALIDPKPLSEPAMISVSQRATIRAAFAHLEILDAKTQFEVVRELTGVRITSVQQLTERDSQTLIHLLANKIATAGRVNTGNSWADRDEDTWIDKL